MKCAKFYLDNTVTISKQSKTTVKYFSFEYYHGNDNCDSYS